MRTLLAIMLTACLACGDNDSILNYSDETAFLGRWIPVSFNGRPTGFNREVFVEFIAGGTFRNQYGQGTWTTWRGTNTIVVVQRDRLNLPIPTYRCKWRITEGRLTLVYMTEWDSWTVVYIPDR